jgi:transient-receptor-potential-like protein
LMKDFQVAPIEIAEASEDNENCQQEPVEENPLDRFRRISKQVASQSTSAKWNEVIRSATIEANSQIGRCRNRDSFRNQQNLLKAMDQARRLIERSPLPPSPNHSDTYSVVDQTNETLVQLLKNITEEINELSPQHTLRVTTPRNRSVTPLHSLNVQLQSLLSSKNPSPCATKEKPKTRPSSPKPASISLRKPSREDIVSPPPRPDTPKATRSGSITAKSPKSPSKFELTKSPLSKPPHSILKARSPTPDSLDDSKSIDVGQKIPKLMTTPSIEISCDDEMQKDRSPTPGSERDVLAATSPPSTPKLIDFRSEPLCQLPGSPMKVVKRKAPAPGDGDISISRPVAPKVADGQGMIPPPPSKEESKPIIQIPVISTTAATPLPTQKVFSVETSEDVKVKAAAPQPPVINKQIDSPPAYSSTEQLVPSSDPGTDANRAASSPPCLRPVNKIDDVKTIKRQMKTGWL